MTGSIAVTCMILLTTGGTAMAADWHVNGTLLGANKSVEIPFQLPIIHESIIFHFTTGGTPYLLLCSSIHVFGRILGPDKIWLRILYLGCHTISPTPTNCFLKGQHSGLLPPLEWESVLGLVINPARIPLKPETGKLFGDMQFEEGTSCAIEGEVPIKGEVVVGAPTLSEEREAQGIRGLGSEENNSLEVGSGNKAFALGFFLFRLAVGTTWSFH
jgi:hypothetical protein